MQTYPPTTRIGQYEIASRPMMGGMGVVYFALDHGNDGRPVALKTFRPELLPDRAARDRFLREGTAWIELGSHPHIVRCYKVEYIDPTAFLVLELIAKEQNMPDASLRSWLIPGHPLPLEQALLFALQIARGMQYATEKIPGFVHRDLKPENILVGADKLPGTNINQLRVTDFGLVKTIANISRPATTSKAEELKPNQVQFTRGAGTPLYMAPEQWRGEQVGVFTDVYAFGCVLYEMLSGQYIARGTTIAELQKSHCGEKKLPLPSHLPKDIEAMVLKCLMVKPKFRYETWSEVISVLENISFRSLGSSFPRSVDLVELNNEEMSEAGWSYNAIGSAYLDLGKVETSKSYFEKALAVGQTNDMLDLARVAYGNLGIVYRDLGDAGKAIMLFEQSLAQHREIGDRHGEATALHNLGNACYSLGDGSKAIAFFEQCLTIRHELGDQSGEAHTLGNLGNVYRDLGDVDKAITLHERALALNRQAGDRRAEGAALGNLAIAYGDLGDIGRAIDLYEQSLLIKREVGDRSGEGNDLGNLGNIYADSGDKQKAIQYYEQSLLIKREVGDRLGEAAALGNIGNIYRQLGNHKQAIEQIQIALQTNREIGNILSASMQSVNLALCLAAQSKFDEAIPILLQAIEDFRQAGYPQHAQTTAKLLATMKASISNLSIPIEVNAAVEAFMSAASPQEIQTAVTKYPFMLDRAFIQSIETTIEQLPRNLRRIIEQRLMTLRQLSRK